MKANSTSIEHEFLSDYQLDYCKNAEKRRAQQRAKYARYPEKIYAMNRAWQQKNIEHWQMLNRFNSKIYCARKRGELLKVAMLVKAKEEYKKHWRLSKVCSALAASN